MDVIAFNEYFFILKKQGETAMLEKCFTIWSDNHGIRNLAEELLFKNHRDNFLWPEKLVSHRQWIDNRMTTAEMKHSYISVTAENKLSDLQIMGIRILYLDTQFRISGDTSGYDVIASGVNSMRACKAAIEIFANQLMMANTLRRTSIFLLPNFSNPNCRYKSRNEATN